MSSFFKSRRSGESRSGGKIPRGSRVRFSPSPYARPESSSLVPAPPPQGGSPSWLTGLISGAGKLIQSVLPSIRSSSSSPSDYTSDYEELSSDDYQGEEELHGLQIIKKSEFVNNCMNEKLAIVPKSESKLALEQLLLQETYTRDECDKLTRLIQSRVVDSSPEVCGNGIEELRSRSRTTGNVIPLPEALLPLKQKMTLPERISYSSSKTNAFYPESSVFDACTPDACKHAVMEAQKWFKEKKSASKPKYDPECGPCTLNTEMLQYDTESEVGSPVDMAKSYMRSLPPWRSPSFGGIGFRTSSSTGMLYNKDETSYKTANHTLSSSKVLKRDHLFMGSLEIHNETRRVRKKSTDECFKDLFSDGAFSLPDKKYGDMSNPFIKGNINSSNGIPEREEIVDAIHSTNENSVPSTDQNPTQHLNENQLLQTVEAADNISVPRDNFASAFRVVENDGVPSSVIKVLPGEETKLGMPSDVCIPEFNDVHTSKTHSSTAVEVPEFNDVHTSKTHSSTAVEVPEFNDVHTSKTHSSTGVEGTIRADSFSELNSLPDSKMPDGNPPITKKSNGSVNEKSEKSNGPINEKSSNGSSSELNTSSGHESRSKGTNTTNKHNGTRMKSIERMLTKPQHTTSRRGKRVVVKSRRGWKS